MESNIFFTIYIYILLNTFIHTHWYECFDELPQGLTVSSTTSNTFEFTGVVSTIEDRRLRSYDDPDHGVALLFGDGIE